MIDRFLDQPPTCGACSCRAPLYDYSSLFSRSPSQAKPIQRRRLTLGSPHPAALVAKGSRGRPGRETQVRPEWMHMAPLRDDDFDPDGANPFFSAHHRADHVGGEEAIFYPRPPVGWSSPRSPSRPWCRPLLTKRHITQLV